MTWTGEHWGRVALGNGPEMDFSAPPDAHGHAGVLTPEDAFVAAANTCIMMMFIWAPRAFPPRPVATLPRRRHQAIEIDRTETFTHLRFWPAIVIRAGSEPPAVVEARVTVER